MSLRYRLMYALGFCPWERAGRGEQADDLFAREESGREPPYGKVLDMGCGSGIWSVTLAQRGWDVTGVDFIPKAIRRARERADEAGVKVDFLQGDVTKLNELGIGSGYDLLLDAGCFHGLTDEERAAEGREATAAAAPDATLLMVAFQAGTRQPLPRGASRSDIERAFAGWEVTDEQALDLSDVPKMVQKAAPRLYRLERRT